MKAPRGPVPFHFPLILSWSKETGTRWRWSAHGSTSSPRADQLDHNENEKALPRGRAGNTLIEMSLALAITGLIAVPLATTIGIQLQIPVAISREVLSKQQDLKSTLVVADDTSVAQTFTPGPTPTPVPGQKPECGTSGEYGTFTWREFNEDRPVPASSRYFFDKGSLFRVIKRGGEETPPHLVATEVKCYADVTFQHIAPKWSYDDITKTWSYTEGLIEFSVTRTRKTEQGETVTVVNRLTADFRPQLTRPVVRPAP